jgi:hypothetical protein
VSTIRKADTFAFGRISIGVGDDKIDAPQASRDHVVDGVAAGAADAEHGDARSHLAKVGNAGHVCSTDCTGKAQALTSSKAPRTIQMGVEVTEGLGAGSQPEVGHAAAEEAIDAIREHLTGAHMVFITAGMGGGKGTGAAPVIAKTAHELGILTIGVVRGPRQPLRYAALGQAAGLNHHSRRR